MSDGGFWHHAIEITRSTRRPHERAADAARQEQARLRREAAMTAETSPAHEVSVP
jgi:hypothetical protein